MDTQNNNRLTAWLKLLIGTAGLSALGAWLAFGNPPPGITGEIIRHNIAENIDATPIFYGDVENMPELEKALEALIAENAKDSSKAHN